MLIPFVVCRLEKGVISQKLADAASPQTVDAPAKASLAARGVCPKNARLRRQFQGRKSLAGRWPGRGLLDILGFAHRVYLRYLAISVQCVGQRYPAHSALKHWVILSHNPGRGQQRLSGRYLRRLGHRRWHGQHPGDQSEATAAQHPGYPSALAL